MEYIYTERAHLMCANMYFGIAMILPAKHDRILIEKSFDTLSQAHPFLDAVLGYEESGNRYFYDVKESSKVQLIFADDDIDSIGSEKITEQYESVTCHDRNITKEGMLKVISWTSGKDSCFLFVFHHLLADGRGALDLCRELLQINPRTNVVFLTAYLEYSFEAWDTRACGFLLKPITTDAVRKQLLKLRFPLKGINSL